MNLPVRRLLFPVGLTATLLFPKQISSQEAPKPETFVSRTYISPALNFYRYEDAILHDVDGIVLGFRPSLIRDLNENFRIELGFGFFNDTGDFTYKKRYRGRANLDMFFLEGSAHYVNTLNRRGGVLYARAGLTLAQINGSINIAGQSRRAKVQGFGSVFGFGVDFKLDEESRIFGEINHGSINGEEIDLSGNGLVVGYKRAL